MKMVQQIYKFDNELLIYYLRQKWSIFECKFLNKQIGLEFIELSLMSIDFNPHCK